jgi:hypothetical protein
MASLSLGMPLVWDSICSSVTPRRPASIGAARSGNTSSMVLFQWSLPCSTRVAATSDVMALVSEPMWKRSSTVTGLSVPARRVPTAPAATIRPSRTTAAARAGSP